MIRTNEHLPIISLFEKFISESERGKRLQKNGALISKSTLTNYKSILKNLKKFEIHSKKEWLFNIRYRASKTNFIKEKRHYKNFYLKYTAFLYSKGCTDNYVGCHIKILRSFFIYLSTSKGYEMGLFYKEFYARKEDIPIIVVNQEQLKFLIHDKEFDKNLTPNLKNVKDIFVVGSTIGLRFSDLIALKPLNLEKTITGTYIINKSKKTNTFTRIKIPEYVDNILKQYRGKQKTLLPTISLVNFNKNIKKMAELAGWTQEIGKIRSRRGVRKDKKTSDGKTYRFCDHISSHVMRRTAITTLLILGMPETLVRKISGHAANSKEFFKYVKYSDSFLDKETDKAFDKLMSM